jgi:hypothetical protein
MSYLAVLDGLDGYDVEWMAPVVKEWTPEARKYFSDSAFADPPQQPHRGVAAAHRRARRQTQ